MTWTFYFFKLSSTLLYQIDDRMVNRNNYFFCLFSISFDNADYLLVISHFLYNEVKLVPNCYG